MNFCEDMLIYNVMTKKMVVYGEKKSGVTSDLSVAPTTEYQTIAKFMPELNGDVYVYFNMQMVSSGITQTQFFSVYNENGDLIHEYNGRGESTPGFDLTDLKAFNKYYIKFKVSDTSGAFYKPTKITILWDVIDNIGINNILTNDL